MILEMQVAYSKLVLSDQLGCFRTNLATRPDCTEMVNPRQTGNTPTESMRRQRPLANSV